MTKRLRFILIGIFFLLLLISFGVNSYFGIVAIFNSSTSGFSSNPDNNNKVVIDKTLANNPAAAVLRETDELVAFNGEPYVRGKGQTSKFLQRARPGTPYTISVRRDAQVQEISLRTAPIPLVRAGIWTILGYLVFAAYFITG